MNIDPKDAEQGVYEKFRVERTDGRSAPGEKHHGCTYFVLDVDHDPYARPALKAYADSCESAFPALAADLRKIRNGHLRFGEAAPGLESISHTVGDGTPGPAPGAAPSDRLWRLIDRWELEQKIPSHEAREAINCVKALRAELARAGTSDVWEQAAKMAEEQAESVKRQRKEAKADILSPSGELDVLALRLRVRADAERREGEG